MDNLKKTENSKKNLQEKSFPSGRTKIADAIKMLLENKDFNAITTAAIAKTAGVTEALIYKYFKDKRDLLIQVLVRYNEDFLSQLELDLKGIKGSLNKLRKLIWSTINCYATNRVYAKILLLELRNFPEYFTSQGYEGIKAYSKIIKDIIDEGINNGEIRTDLPSSFIRQVILGAIEHICLPGIIFNREILTDTLTDHLCDILFKGLSPN